MLVIAHGTSRRCSPLVRAATARHGVSSRTWHPARLTEDGTAPLVQLRNLQYPNTEFAQADYIQWQRAKNPAGLAVAWVAHDEHGQMVGEYWMVPVRFKIGGELRLGAVGANALVHPDYRRTDVFTVLGQRCSEDCARQRIEFTLYVPNDLSLKGLIRKLACESLGSLTLMFYPLRPGEIAERRCQGKLVRGLLANAMRFTSRSTSRSRDTAVSGAQIQCVEVTAFGKMFDSFWHRVENKYPCMAVRDSAFMNWRYATAPSRQYQTIFATQGDHLLGYLVLRSGRFQGLKSGFIMDFLVQPTSAGITAGRLLVDAALERFRAERAGLACCLTLPHTEECRLLRDRGFVACPAHFRPHPFRLVAQIHGQRNGLKPVLDISQWFWLFGDYDIL
jgi:GNAT superfamily N-acetyltransferase